MANTKTILSFAKLLWFLLLIIVLILTMTVTRNVCVFVIFVRIFSTHGTQKFKSWNTSVAII